MDFDLNDEQRLLKESVERLLADRYDFETRNTWLGGEPGWSADMWGQYADLGLLALPFSSDHGGMDGGPVETMIVMEAFGKGLVVEPYFSTVILSGGVLRHGASEGQKAHLVPQIAEGGLKLALAQTERQSRYDLFDVATSARADGEGWVIDGAKGVVLHGDSADRLIVTARTAGDRRDTDGIGVFLVDASAPGVSRRGYRTQDGHRAADVMFENVRVGPEAVIGDPEGGLPLVARAVDEAIAALCAEAVGGLDEMYQLTVEYLKMRKQFGVPIGDFQVLQHAAADMFIDLEQARSMTMFATVMAHSDDAQARRRAVSAAKVQIGRSAMSVGQNAIQLHGGVGMTMEFKVGHYFKRATMIDATFGNAAYHLARVADAGSLIAA
ncbi:acyl-CoA dehydrogenase family protein [Microbaculum marinisediminis]|uniref:Acyl-CoA dehydrogenase family protein n=1 Tax=Microbaculum marinisediminis TaxID=2931392 RepID=A0AAW5QYZ6_9HYPH|nr:acyl-CoA dehydrogenase family protein [Microbaculum sp. A6E488]MCT8971873.1 acyl-CoA dehydrogenase family protein [Microbaculum sp. A6E488]